MRNSDPSVAAATHPRARSPLAAAREPLSLRIDDMDGDGNERERAGIQSVEVGFALLQALAQADGPLMLRDVAQAAHMSAAKAHRYLVSFQRLGLVAQDAATARYDLGPQVLHLGLAALRRIDAVNLARQRLPQWRHDIGHTVALAVWGNLGPTIVHWVEPLRPVAVHLRLGDVMPLLTSATGRCFAAYLPPTLTHNLLAAEMAHWQQRETLDPALVSARGVPTDEARCLALWTEVRQRGLARVVDTLLPGIAGFCAPVFDAAGHMVLGVVSMGPTGHFDARWGGPVAQRLAAAADGLTADLGGVVPGRTPRGGPSR
jgi:DNA-binding IclR family transcriptional regulator